MGSGQIVRGYDSDFSDVSQCRSLLKGAHLAGYSGVSFVDPYFDHTLVLPKDTIDEIAIYADLEEVPSTLFEDAHGMIASPDALHFSNACMMIEKGIKAIFLEKPMALCSKDALLLLELAKSNDVYLFVNYFRKYLPSYQTLKQSLISGELGQPKLLIAKYGKGLYHNGSHMIDLVHFLFGQVYPSTLLQKIDDYVESDPSIGFTGIVQYNHTEVPFSCFAVNSSDYTHFELECYTTKGKIYICDLGRSIQFFSSVADPNLNGYNVLQLIDVWTTEYMFSGMYSVKAFKGRETFHSSDEALRAIQVCEIVGNLI